MAVSLPSDLIADVMRNADPARLQTARAKLEILHETEGSATNFAALLGRIDGEVAAAPNPDELPGSRNGLLPAAQQPGVAAADEPYADFERMVLRNLFESLLPGAESGAFGGGPSAGVWRSLAADQLAGLYADTGGVGVARMLAGEEARNAGAIEGQWPYFRPGPVQAFAADGPEVT